jgi:hypothetical protein
MIDEHGVIDGTWIGRGNRSILRKPAPMPLCPQKNPARPEPGSNPDRRGGKPASNRPKCGMAYPTIQSGFGPAFCTWMLHDGGSVSLFQSRSFTGWTDGRPPGDISHHVMTQHFPAAAVIYRSSTFEMAYGNFSLMVHNPIREHHSIVTLSSSLASKCYFVLSNRSIPFARKTAFGAKRAN